MFSLGSLTAASPDFIPDERSQGWLLRQFMSVIEATAPHSDPRRPWVHVPPSVPQDLDGFFDFICALQAQIGQDALDLTVLPIQDGNEDIPSDYRALSSGQGQLMQTLFGRGEYVLCFGTSLFKKTELLLASIARELGRIALHHSLAHSKTALEPISSQDPAEAPLGSARAELAAFALGTGLLITNGSYIFENGCCGGGCGINLKSLQTGLSMPEAAFIQAVDTIRRQEKPRAIAKHLAPNQKAAFKDNYKTLTRRGTTPQNLHQLATSNTLALPE